MNLAWQFNEYTPVYLQIANRLRDEIIKGNYPRGSQIPTVRQLALIAAVNPNTVQRALTELENEGLLCAKGTQGRFVTEDDEELRAAANNAALDLVREFLSKAENLAISRERLIEMLKEESKA
ncbi:MAG: GntR family transcriptional regulator [Clostridia bacterium]|nr:GntR family transcriptional regulator [Clostridia bacterium]MBQ5901400.1 GntR family transcriptional regulator [Clostridia bacterium]